MSPRSHLVSSHFMLRTFSLQKPLGKNNRIPQLWSILSLACVGSSKSLQSGRCLHVNHIRLWERSSERGPWNHLALDSHPGSATLHLHEFDQVASPLCIRFLICNNTDNTYLLERSVMSLKSLHYGLWHISSRWKHRCLCFCNYCSWIGERLI